MTQLDCTTLRDRMPDVAAARGAWTDLERAHLDGCDPCREEWSLVQAAASLGAEVERGFDASHVASRVVARWREAPVLSARPGRWTVLAGLAAAAAIVLLLLPRAPAPPPTAAPVFLTELDSLTTDELVLVADGLALPLAGLESPEDASLSDLDTTQLTRVLRSLEG